MKRIVLIVVVLASQSVAALSWQQPSPNIVSKLRGRTEKVWVFIRWETQMGGTKCERGESWTFFQNGRLLIKRCIDGSITNEEKRWKLEKRSQIDDVVIIDSGEYRISFPPNAPRGKEQMKLRQIAKIKSMKTKDMIFYHEVD